MNNSLNNIKYIVGIDEVGRGPLAGPVAVCSFVCKPDLFDFIPTSSKDGRKIYIRDSKKLTKKRREAWAGYFLKAKKEGKCDYFVSFVSSEIPPNPLFFKYSSFSSSV